MQNDPHSSPYDEPTAAVNLPQGPVKPVSVTASSGLNWVSDAWALFKSSPWMLIALWLVLLVAVTAANIIPLVGQLLTPVLMAGFIMGVAQLDRGEKLSIESIFAGFKNHAAPLLVLGGIFIVTIILLILVCWLFVALAINAMNSGSGVAVVLGAFLLIAVGAFAILMVVFAMWWSPSLIVFNQQRPWQAMKNAIIAIFRNFIPCLVYGLILLLLYLAVVVTAGLGVIVVGPLVIVSAYTSYKDIFRPV